MHTVRELSKKRNKNGNNEKEETCKFVGKEQKEYREKKKNTEKAACSDDHFISADRADRDRPGPSAEQQGQAQRKEEAIAALESVPTITPTPVATVTPTPTPVPTATPTPVITREPAFNPEDYIGTWYSTNGRVTVQITKLTEKSITFTYTQVNKKGTAVCEASAKKSVAGNAARVSFTDSLGNKAKGYFTFDNGMLYVKIKTTKKAEGAGVKPSVDCIMVRG